MGAEEHPRQRDSSRAGQDRVRPRAVGGREGRNERIQATPLRRLGEPRDIGGIAVFLASDAAAFITGQCIVADGGFTIL